MPYDAILVPASGGLKFPPGKCPHKAGKLQENIWRT
jgi:hypothetical protein